MPFVPIQRAKRGSMKASVSAKRNARGNIMFCIGLSADIMEKLGNPRRVGIAEQNYISRVRILKKGGAMIRIGGARELCDRERPKRLCFFDIDGEALILTLDEPSSAPTQAPPKISETEPSDDGGDLNVSIAPPYVRRGSRRCVLTESEARILGVMNAAIGKIMPTEEIARRCYGTAIDMEMVFKKQVAVMAPKLKNVGAEIVAAKGIGYVLRHLD